MQSRRATIILSNKFFIESFCKTFIDLVEKQFYDVIIASINDDLISSFVFVQSYKKLIEYNVNV